MNNNHLNAVNKAQHRIAVILLAFVALLLAAIILSVLESESLYHAGTASGWYEGALNFISLA